MTRSEALTLPWRVRWPQAHPRTWLARHVPTRRSLGLGLGILAFALGAYVLARETSLFAVERIDVQGGSPRVAAQVRQALAPLVGTTLVGLDGSAVLRRVDALPSVVRSSYDRSFPHTLRVTVVPERPGAVLRSGTDSWLLSVRGRVIARLATGADPQLPRIWVPHRTPVRPGLRLSTGGAAVAARAVGLAGSFATRVATASDKGGVLVFHLRSGRELVLGGAGDVKLKVAVAARALAVLPSDATFLDVTVPSRPVSGAGTPVSTSDASSSRG